MVARDVPENDNISAEVITNGESLSTRISNNAEVEIPEYRKQLLDAKESMSNAADMYHQDYLDKVEQRADLTVEARDKAVLCLVDVSKKIYNLAGCFQQLIEDQMDKLQEIENLTQTATASLEITSCYNFRNELHTKLPPANVPNRQPRIGRPETMQTNFYKENVFWEKLNYDKYDRLGAGFLSDEFLHPGEANQMNSPPMGKSNSQQSLNSIASSTRSHVTGSSVHSPTLQNHNTLRTQGSRLTVSSVDVSREPSSPALNRYGSSSSLTSINSTKSEITTKRATFKKPVTVKRTLSSLRITPARSAPAPPPNKQNPSRPRVYSVKNETGEGLDKPTIPAPQPPSEEDHYATPPAHRMPTLNEERERATPTPEVIYQDVKSRAPAVAPPPAPPPPQYQTIAIAQPDSDSEFEDVDDVDDVDDDDIYTDVDNVYDAPSLTNNTASGATGIDYTATPRDYPATFPSPGSPLPLPEQQDDDDDMYIENDMLPPVDEDMYIDNDLLPPPPSDILPPPPPPEGDDIYTDNILDDNLYTDNVVDHTDMVNAHTVSVSKDSGFYTEDPEDDDNIIEKVRAIYPYAATASDELNLVVGDLVAVHVKNPDGWYEGSLNGVRGLFPGNYVEPAD